MKFLQLVNEQERVFLMLPDNFDFAMMPTGSAGYALKEVGMFSSTIEDIDYTITSWLKKDLELYCNTNEGRVKVPVLWQAPERAYQIKNDKDLRDENNTLKLPLISIERTNITKNPEQKGSYQAHLYSDKKNGRSGRFVIAKEIVPDKTQNFAIASGTRTNTGAKRQRFYPRSNKKVVIRTLSIPIPVYVNVEYKIKLKTEYQQNMNELVTPFISRTGQINAFSLSRNGHIYEVFIDQSFSHNNNLATLNEEIREFNTEISLRVLGYLIGEGENDDRPIVRIDENIVEYVFPTETTVPEGFIDFSE